MTLWCFQTVISGDGVIMSWTYVRFEVHDETGFLNAPTHNKETFLKSYDSLLLSAFTIWETLENMFCAWLRDAESIVKTNLFIVAHENNLYREKTITNRTWFVYAKRYMVIWYSSVHVSACALHTFYRGVLTNICRKNLPDHMNPPVFKKWSFHV